MSDLMIDLRIQVKLVYMMIPVFTYESVRTYKISRALDGTEVFHHNYYLVRLTYVCSYVDKPYPYKIIED